MQHATEIADLTKPHTLVELGSGSSEKTHLLLEAARRTGSLQTYVPVDVSSAALEEAVPGLVARYPGLEVHGVVADFEHHLDLLPGERPRLVAFLGGTIGNFEPATGRRFLAALAATMSPGDALLLGTDLVKDADRLVPAYDDAAGVTAEFNLNVLRVINRELDADFDVDAFEHVAVWDAEREWIEMRLRSLRDQTVTVAGARHPRRLRRRRGDAHRDLGEVPRGGCPPRARRGGAAADPLVDRRRLRAVPRDGLTRPGEGQKAFTWTWS